MSNPLVYHEGYILDDADNLIWTAYVDLREHADRSLVSTLVKGCRKRYAIEFYKKVRISKPEQFRRHGPGLIRDPSEAQGSHTLMFEETVEDPYQLPEVQLLSEAVAKASKNCRLPIEITEQTARISRKTVDWLICGKNGWIFSTSIEPTNKKEWDKWKDSLPEEYDHISRIHRRREFARALGSMVVEELGPQGQEAKAEHSFEGLSKFCTQHMSQLIIHGPVRYVEDPYELMSTAKSGWEEMLLPLFVKGMDYQDQREYRFAICTEKEPSDETVDLNASLALLRAMKK